jgi:hypothetical protein
MGQAERDGTSDTLTAPGNNGYLTFNWAFQLIPPTSDLRLQITGRRPLSFWFLIYDLGCRTTD